MNIKLLKDYLHSPNYEAQMHDRYKMLKEAADNPLARADYWRRFRENFNEFCELAVWIEEPRYIEEPELMFLPFPYQAELAWKTDEAIANQHDLFIEKNRDMGVSWLYAAYITHRFLFFNDFHALLGSRKEDYVDNNMTDSMFGKVRFIMSHAPIWLKPKNFSKRLHDNHMKLINPSNGSSIQGESSNENFGRGGRYMMILADEIWFWKQHRQAIRAMRSSTHTIVFVSTPAQTSYAKQFVEGYKKLGYVITLGWEQNPFKDKDWLEGERERAGSDVGGFMTEVEGSYDIDPQKQYYPEAHACEERPLEYDPSLPIYQGLDFGAHADYSAVIWYQVTPEKEVRVMDAILSHGVLMPDKLLLEWWKPFLHINVPLDERYYSESERQQIARWMDRQKPRMFFGEAAHKQRMMPAGFSIQQMFAKDGSVIISNDRAITHAPRRLAVQKYLPTTVFNANSMGAKMVAEALKSAEKSTSADGSVKPVHTDDGSSDLRAAHENFCASYMWYVDRFSSGKPISYIQNSNRLYKPSYARRY